MKGRKFAFSIDFSSVIHTTLHLAIHENLFNQLSDSIQSFQENYKKIAPQTTIRVIPLPLISETNVSLPFSKEGNKDPLSLIRYLYLQRNYAGVEPGHPLITICSVDQPEGFIRSTFTAEFPSLVIGCPENNGHGSKFEMAWPLIAHLFLYQLSEEVQQLFMDKNHTNHCLNLNLENTADIPMALVIGDICDKCLQKYLKENINATHLHTLVELIERGREQLLNRSFLPKTAPSCKVHVVGKELDIYIQESSLIKLPFTPLEKVTYLLFLSVPEGIKLTNVHIYASWLNWIYKQVATTRQPRHSKKYIEQLTDPSDNSISEKISRIRSKINKIAKPETANNCIIQGPRGGERRIALSSQQIEIDPKAATVLEQGKELLSENKSSPPTTS